MQNATVRLVSWAPSLWQTFYMAFPRSLLLLTAPILFVAFHLCDVLLFTRMSDHQLWELTKGDVISTCVLLVFVSCVVWRFRVWPRVVGFMIVSMYAVVLGAIDLISFGVCVFANYLYDGSLF